MSSEYILATLVGDVTAEEVTLVAVEYENFCKALYKDWSGLRNNLFPVAAWDGNTWANQVEARGKRWNAFNRPSIIDWWAEKGFGVEIGRNGALTIARADSSIERTFAI